MNTAGVQFKITADTKELNTALRNTKKQVDQTAKGAEGAGKSMSALGAIKLAAVSVGLKTVTSALVDMGVAAYETFSVLDDGARQVATLSKDYEGSADLIKLVSMDTGTSIDVVADSMYNALSAGVDYADVQKFLVEQHKLSIGGFTDLNTAVIASAKVINSYGLDMKDLNSVNATFLHSQNNGIITVDQMGKSIANVLPTAAAFKVSFDQVGAAIAGLTAGGTPAQQATTQLNQMLSELGKSGTIVSGILTDKTGKSFQDLTEEGHTLTDVLAIVQEAADENGLSMIDMFGSIDAGKAALALTGKAGDTFRKTMQDIASDTGIVDENFQQMIDGSPKHELDRLSTAGEALQVTLIESLAPAINKISKWLTTFVSYLQENESALLALQMVLVAVVIVVIALTIAVTAYAVAQLAALWPIVLITAAILGLIALIAVIITYWDTLTAVTKATWKLFVMYVKTAWNTMVTYLQAQWTKFNQMWKDLWTGITNSIIQAWTTIQMAVVSRWNAIVNKFKTGLKNIRTFFTDAWNNIKTGVSNFGTYLKNSVTSAINVVSSKLSAFKNKLLGFKNSIVNAFSNIWSGIKSGVSSGIDSLVVSVKRIANSFIGNVNSAIGIINKIPKVSIPNVPYLAKGGVVGTSGPGTLAVVGEAGPEAVIPLKKSVLSQIGTAILHSMPATNTIDTKTVDIGAINIYPQDASNPSSIVDAVEEALRILSIQGGI